MHAHTHTWGETTINGKNTAHETFIYCLVSSKIEKHFLYMENVNICMTYYYYHPVLQQNNQGIKAQLIYSETTIERAWFIMRILL